MTNLGPFSVTMLDKDLLARLRGRMAEVDELLKAATKGDYPPVTEVARYLFGTGGKRFRPALTLLTAEFGDPAAAGVVATAAACELTHLATLHHDDVMDDAKLRRGSPNANAKWGNLVAILTGDFLFSKASLILSELGPEAVRIQAKTFERLVSGQIRETQGVQPGEDPLTHHLGVVADKTGALIATSAQFGALIAGASAEVVRTVTDFGELVGIAFQPADDILDITSSAGQSGKTPGTDLREGVDTLAVLRVRAEPRAQDRRLLELLDLDLTDDLLHAEALGLLRAHPALAKARQDCVEYSERARALLRDVRPGAARDAMHILCDLAVHRVR